jgi:hypothetical protein
MQRMTKVPEWAQAMFNCDENIPWTYDINVEPPELRTYFDIVQYPNITFEMVQEFVEEYSEGCEEICDPSAEESAAGICCRVPNLHDTRDWLPKERLTCIIAEHFFPEYKEFYTCDLLEDDKTKGVKNSPEPDCLYYELRDQDRFLNAEEGVSCCTAKDNDGNTVLLVLAYEGEFSCVRLANVFNLSTVCVTMDSLKETMRDQHINKPLDAIELLVQFFERKRDEQRVTAVLMALNPRLGEESAISSLADCLQTVLAFI